MRALSRYLSFAALVALTACASAPVRPIDHTAEWTRACSDVFLQELERPIDPAGADACLELARGGAQDADLRAWVRGSDEYAALQESKRHPPAPEILPLRADGRSLVTTDGRTYRGLLESGLTLLVVAPAARDAFLDQATALGLGGIRVFAGALQWAGQTADAAASALPDLLDAAAARGLRVQVAAITDSAAGYDVAAHLRRIAAIVAAHPNALLEIANEPDHPTQAKAVRETDSLVRLARENVPAGVLYALGAAAWDEPQKVDPACMENCETWWPQPAPGGLVTLHLDRGRDLWNQVRRIRELAAVSEATRLPVISGEPQAIAEAPVAGKNRITGIDAESWSFVLGALCRGFEIAVCVLHTEDGLQGRLLGQQEQKAARAFVEGARAIGAENRLQFANARWAGSPVRGARFVDRYGAPGVIRAYSFLDGGRGWTVLVGVTGDPGIEWGNGWRAVRLVAERPGVQVWEIGR